MCLYYAHRTFKLQKIWQQQLKPVQKTTLQRSRSTSARPVVACRQEQQENPLALAA